MTLPRTSAATIGSTSAPPLSSGFVMHWGFHGTLVSSTGNPLLRLMCPAEQQRAARPLDRDRISRDVWDRGDAGHVDIHRAVAVGDADTAERPTRGHLHSLRPPYERMED